MVPVIPYKYRTGENTQSSSSKSRAERGVTGTLTDSLANGPDFYTQQITVRANTDNQTFTLPGVIVGYLNADANSNYSARGMGLLKTGYYMSMGSTSGNTWNSTNGSTLTTAGNYSIYIKSLTITGNKIIVSAGSINWSGYDRSSGPMTLVYSK